LLLSAMCSDVGFNESMYPLPRNRAGVARISGRIDHRFRDRSYNDFGMFDFDSPSFQRSLAETIAWCSSQPLTAHAPESAAILHRRALRQEAGKWMQQAYERVDRSWFRRVVSKTKEWRRAMALLEEAPLDSLVQLTTQLRSAALKPTFALDEFGTDAPWSEAVAEVVAKRRQMVGQKPEAAARESDGRILIYVPSENLADGAAQYSSNGFFDVNNVPPWDIGVHFAEEALISWVPRVLGELAQSGREVNPEECIRWAD